MIHRSFIVPFPPGQKVTEARFTAPVVKFLGVAAARDGIVLCTLADQKPEDLVPSGLVLPSGMPAPQAPKVGEPLWIVQVCYESDEQPEHTLYLGSVLTVFGPVAVYVRRG